MLLGNSKTLAGQLIPQFAKDSTFLSEINQEFADWFLIVF
jgi:hypothetical protein